MRRVPLLFPFLSCLLAILTAGCASDQNASGNDAKTAASSQPAAPPPKGPPQPFPATAAPGAKEPKAGEEVAVLDTDLGTIVLKFFPEVAPRHVKNFKDLTMKGFYDGTKFHRTMPGFMIQGGDPNSKTGDPSTWGQGDAGYKIKGEMNRTRHTRGILSMARSTDPDSAGSQFFITVADVSDQLDPQFDSAGKLVPGKEGYTVFGQVVQGMDVADQIVALPNAGAGGAALQPVTIKSVKLEKWPLKKS